MGTMGRGWAPAQTQGGSCMEKRQSPALLIEETPEVKSFIYQQIVDFEPFLTSTSLVSVISKTPEERPKKRAQFHNILITIKENGVSLEEEGSSENIYEAILEAKNKLYKKLVSIQDSVVSQQDRLAQIHSIRSNTSLH
jgi:ribosomal subunit interface protein